MAVPHVCRPNRIDCPVCHPEAHKNCGCTTESVTKEREKR